MINKLQIMNKDQIDYQSYVGKTFIHMNEELNNIHIVYVVSYDKSHDLFNAIYLKSRYNAGNYIHHVFTKITINIWIKRLSFTNDHKYEWKTVIV